MLLSQTLLLKDHPKEIPYSLEEMFALAHAMEREAARKYDELATAMQEQGLRDFMMSSPISLWRSASMWTA